MHLLRYYLQVPKSLKKEIYKLTSDPMEQKKIYLKRWLSDHPAPSWVLVAEALYKVEEHDVLELVKNRYITGMLGIMQLYANHLLRCYRCNQKCVFIAGGPRNYMFKVRTIDSSACLQIHHMCLTLSKQTQ